MREIKFRAWITIPRETISYLHENTVEDGNMSRSFSFTDFDGSYFILECCDISDMIIMQYTGLKDKNGVEIYEGDIVKMGENYHETIANRKWRVTWQQVNFLWAFETGRDEFWKMYTFSDLNPHDGDCEVIGNIYENPEPLKDGQDVM